MTASSQNQPGALPPGTPLARRPMPLNEAFATTSNVLTTDGTAGGQPVEAERDAGNRFDAASVKAAVSAAREQGRAEASAALQSAREAAGTAAYFRDRYEALQQLLAGHPDTHLMSVGEILAAVDGRDPRAGTPLVVEWNGVVMGPSGDTTHENTLVPCTTVLGGPAVLVLTPRQRAKLAQLLAVVRDWPEPDTEDSGEPTAVDDQAADPRQPAQADETYTAGGGL
ncbi:hypothetical protein [Streptomyces sp. NPDC016626]|uniref:hypothetical protein n=1 Tax=Streptomyces sp. NPDC016626 TaxID=3364968 RepID=UPI0036FF5C18